MQGRSSETRQRRGRADRRLSRRRTPVAPRDRPRYGSRGNRRPRCRARARGRSRRGRRPVLRPLPDRGSDGRLVLVAREQPREHGLHARPRRVGRLRGEEAEVGQAPLRDLPERGDRPPRGAALPPQAPGQARHHADDEPVRAGRRSEQRPAAVREKGRERARRAARDARQRSDRRAARRVRATIKDVEGWKVGQTYRRGDPALPEAARR